MKSLTMSVLILLFFLFGCQSTASMSDSAAIASLQALLQRLAQTRPVGDFAALQAHFGETAEPVSAGQFNLANWDSCLVDLVFAKTYDGPHLSHLDLNIAPACTLRLSDLQSAFGPYQQPPMRRRGEASALFTYQPTPEGPAFTLIAQAPAPLEAGTSVGRLSIRVE